MGNLTRRDFLNLLKGTGAVIGVGAVEGFTIWQDLYLPFVVRH